MIKHVVEQDNVFMSSFIEGISARMNMSKPTDTYTHERMNRVLHRREFAACKRSFDWGRIYAFNVLKPRDGYEYQILSENFTNTIYIKENKIK